VFFNVKKT